MPRYRFVLVFVGGYILMVGCDEAWRLGPRNSAWRGRSVPWRYWRGDREAISRVLERRPGEGIG